MSLCFRLLMGIVIAYVVWVTPSFKSGESEFPISYYIMLLIVYALHQVSWEVCLITNSGAVQ